ncbi:MAG TPA: TonB-dependent receptor [Bacteroidia bacterium]|nr:TonB-dependent receptor [Bacteroidia bacterium]HNT81041.1 TonB-dependent receptor [Bacteroidia bacterium]
MKRILTIIRSSASVSTLFLLISSQAYSQSITQVIRGSVFDKQTHETLIGANVIIVNSDPFKGAASDANGKYRIEGISPGRYDLKISYLGYKEQFIQIMVISGKESILDIELEESVFQASEVTITAQADKDKPINEMAAVSARMFTIEETSRFAGSRNDPAKMAQNYAGVSGANDARNDIIIRGNSPLGVLWRLNGLDIPNPNHFGTLGTTGGPISMLNNNLLDNSEFYTGAFPAEYGNALAGVFDLRLRRGNNETHEFLGMVGFNGFEIGAEGPFNKNKNSSYLLNYRYSTLGVFHALGIDFGTGSAVPEYQDISYRFDFKTKKAGTFSLFGLGGYSTVTILDKDRDTSDTDLYSSHGYDSYYTTYMSSTGLNHSITFSSNAWLSTTLAYSYQGVNAKEDSVDRNTYNAFPYYRNFSNESKAKFKSVYHKKFNARNFLKAGIDLSFNKYHYIDSFYNDNQQFEILTDFEGNTLLSQLFTEWQHKFTDQLQLLSGIHFQHLKLNNTISFEPRIAIKYDTPNGSKYSLGLGIHSQMQPTYIYFNTTLLDDGTYVRSNKDLKFTDAAHLVLAYDRKLGEQFRLKTEAYYQYIYNVPVEKDKTYFSLLNAGADFGIDDVDFLVNKGSGRNIGLECTIEKFFSRTYYFLITSTLFSSTYKGSDNIERHTTFDGNYVFNALFGKEWTIKERNKLAINLKTNISGGKRYIPIDFEKSALEGEEVLDYQNAFENKFKDYYRTDFKISYRINKKKSSQEISLSIDNIFNTRNIWERVYDPESNTLQTVYQIGFFPIPQYKIEF